MLSDSSVDEDIAAAFAGKDSPPAAVSNIDDDIAAAFRKTGETKEQKGITGIPTSLDMQQLIRPLPNASAEDKAMLEREKNPASTLPPKLNPLNWPTMLADAGADRLAEGSRPGEVTNPEAKNPANWTQAESPSPIAATALHMAPIALPMLGALKRAGGPVAAPSAGNTTATAQAQADRAYAMQSQGAAAKAPDVSKLTPETQEELARGAATGQTPNSKALERIHDAETLPVPVRLMPGQALGDPAKASAEFNAKGKHPEIGAWMDDQNEALKANMDEFRRDAAPSAVGNSTLQNSQSLIDHLKDVAAQRKTATTTAYNEAKAANGGNLQMDGSTFVNAAETALKPQSKYRFLPPAARGIIDDVQEANGQMSLDDFEAHRTTLANEVRKAQRAGDGNAVRAISVVRDALENTPLTGATAQAKGLYDKARSLAKADFDEQKMNPAYSAVVDDLDITPKGQASDLNKNFVQKYIVGGTQANLQRLRAMFQGNDEANQTMTAAALNHLKESANINPVSNAGNFSQHGFNNAYSYDIAPRAKELLQDPELIDKVEQLGRTARYTQEQTRGSSFNNSHTFVAAQADTVPGKLARGAVKTVPYVGDMAAEKLTEMSRAKARQQMLDRILKPGAGLYDD